jgi:hypothetical protein
MSDEAPLMMVRRGSFLAPYTPFDSEQLEGFPAGRAMRVKLTQPRSVPHHRLYWAMLNKVCENLDTIPPKTLHGLVKLRCGYAIEVRTKSGVERIPGSIAFDKMTAPEFREFFERAVTFICEQVLPGLRSADLKREIEQMLGVAA